MASDRQIVSRRWCSVVAIPLASYITLAVNKDVSLSSGTLTAAVLSGLWLVLRWRCDTACSDVLEHDLLWTILPNSAACHDKIRLLSALLYCTVQLELKHRPVLLI